LYSDLIAKMENRNDIVFIENFELTTVTVLQFGSKHPKPNDPGILYIYRLYKILRDLCYC